MCHHHNHCYVECISMAFVLVGSLMFLGVVWLRTRYLTRSLVYACVHGVCSWAIMQMAFSMAGSTSGLIAITIACAWYQATWFTSAFIFGEKLTEAFNAKYFPSKIGLSSVQGAVWAAILEGVGGYLGFVIVKGHFY